MSRLTKKIREIQNYTKKEQEVFKLKLLKFAVVFLLVAACAIVISILTMERVEASHSTSVTENVAEYEQEARQTRRDQEEAQIQRELERQEEQERSMQRSYEERVINQSDCNIKYISYGCGE